MGIPYALRGFQWVAFSIWFAPWKLPLSIASPDNPFGAALPLVGGGSAPPVTITASDYRQPHVVDRIAEPLLIVTFWVFCSHNLFRETCSR
jgi:hypothetical protein